MASGKLPDYFEKLVAILAELVLSNSAYPYKSFEICGKACRHFYESCIAEYNEWRYLLLIGEYFGNILNS